MASLEIPLSNREPILASDKMSNLLLLAEPSVPNDRFIFFEFSKMANGIPEPGLRLETGQQKLY